MLQSTSGMHILAKCSKGMLQVSKGMLQTFVQNVLFVFRRMLQVYALSVSDIPKLC
jgi:hypothetical protein